MIKADSMGEFMETLNIASTVTLDQIQEALGAAAQEANLPLGFSADTVTSGGLFNKVTEPCLVLFHPDHQNDYFRIAIRAAQEAGHTFVMSNIFATSKQIKKELGAAASKEDRRGKSMSYKAGSLLVSGVMNMGRSKQKLEAEQRYYALLEELIRSIFV